MDLSESVLVGIVNRLSSRYVPRSRTDKKIASHFLGVVSCWSSPLLR